MSSFTLSDRHLAILNVFLGLAVLYYLALCVSDLFRLHYAPAVLPAESEYAPATRPQPAGVRTRQFYDVIVRRDIFSLVPPPESAPVADEHLDAILVGTSQVTSGKPYAIIENGGNQAVYRVGDTVPGAGELLSVGRDRVIILHDGHRVALELPKQGITAGAPLAPPPPRPFRRNPGARQSMPAKVTGQGVKQVAANRYVLDRATVNSNLQNLVPLFTEIRATPQIINGGPSGFLLTEIQPNSIFQQIGLQNGDLLQMVNGQQVGDPLKAFGLLQSLRDKSEITLKVLRDGAPQQVSYTIH